VGHVVNGTYVTARTQAHFMFKYQGFGLSEDIMRDLAHGGVDTVQLHYAGAHGTRVYSCPLAKFMQSAKRHVYERGRAKDAQRFVSARDMTVLDDRRTKGGAKADRRRPEPHALQGTLFS